MQNQTHNTQSHAQTQRRFEVQRHCPLIGWNTWVIYDEKQHADNECARRISESPIRDKNSWRVIPANPLED